jgi:hypothetical protein
MRMTCGDDHFRRAQSDVIQSGGKVFPAAC